MMNRIRLLLAAMAIAAMVCFAQSCARKQPETQTYEMVLPAETVERSVEPSSAPVEPQSTPASQPVPGRVFRTEEGPSYPTSIIDR